MRFTAHGFFVSDRINRMDKMNTADLDGQNSVDSVHSVEKPLPNGASGMSDIEGKAATGSGERDGSRSSFNSTKVYVSGTLHKDVSVPFREIALAPTKSVNGKIEVNEPVRVYDTSGPWGDPDFHGDVTQGLPPFRAKWIRDRGEVEEHDGRKVQPIDDGFLSAAHAEHLAKRNGSEEDELTIKKPGGRKPLRAKSGAVTQLAYARRGIITPEMEFIAIRENHRIASQREEVRSKIGNGSDSELHNS